MPHLPGAVVAKAKVAALITAAMAAGGVGGAVALSHAVPASHLVRDTAASSPTDDPETGDAQGSGDQDPETSDAQNSDDQGSGDQDPETGDAQDPGAGDGDYTLPVCPTDVKNHGKYVSSVAHSAPKGKHGEHGKWVSQAARSDCGKKAADDSQDPETGDAQDPETADSNDGGDAGQESGTTDNHTAKPHPSKTAHGHGHGDATDVNADASSWSKHPGKGHGHKG